MAWSQSGHLVSVSPSASRRRSRLSLVTTWAFSITVRMWGSTPRISHRQRTSIVNAASRSMLAKCYLVPIPCGRVPPNCRRKAPLQFLAKVEGQVLLLRVLQVRRMWRHRHRRNGSGSPDGRNSQQKPISCARLVWGNRQGRPLSSSPVLPVWSIRPNHAQSFAPII